MLIRRLSTTILPNRRKHERKNVIIYVIRQARKRNFQRAKISKPLSENLI
jgi:hypothetical protein